MKHITIIVPMGSTIIDTIIAPYNLLLMANSYYKRIHKSDEAPFKIDLAGLSDESVQYQGLFTVTPTTTIEKIKHTDLIIVTAINGNLDKGIEDKIFVK